ncbi:MULTISPECIES: BglG family transcription antiterminator LicT [Virgibacillus]|uniref:PRD domain-containing protein n=1 Tax=Virgibacillus salarius TaxID=447199 RepID=A0A941DVT0_9BACI|nr:MULTISPECIES: PRD domain-containing protein [Bacillaceae]MBR7795133.1 PRD domain-containing protein [Virgibacillus salarius]MDY7042951.1 PRD domain-containing protein [Virgibacillus sp. M23]NAZ07849.1 PRD domain-containing protein [Agaribacter marinus]
MKIHKVLNNNVVSAFDEEGMELVVMGRGLAFQKKAGQEIEADKIEKVFTLKDQQTFDNFKLLLREIPAELMSEVELIIKDAKEALNTELNEKIYLSLPDHIHFSIERYQQGITIRNDILWEIKQLYKDEFAVGKRAVARINQRFDVELPEDEAAFIAIHIIEANMNEDTENTFNTTKFIQQIINIVKYHFNVEFNEDSLNYGRFITHLKYFAQRVFNGSHYKNDDDYLYIMIKQKHKEASKCTEKIKSYIKRQYNHELTNEEMLYLTIHIERVVNR